MKSAIELVAFANCDRFSGTISLLKVAQRALERDGHIVASAHLDMAIHAYVAQETDRTGRCYGGTGQAQ